MYTRFRSDRTNRSAEDAAGAGVTVADLNMTKADFTEALKLHEIAPYWRDRIIANSFRPLPFTALQQMWQFGLKDRNWFKGRLEDYGYSAGNADNMLNVWERKWPFGIKNPIRTNPIKKFMRGEATRDQTIASLKTAGISNDTATWIVDVYDTKLLENREKKWLGGWRNAYRRKNMSDADLRSMIAKRVSNPQRVTRLMREVADSNESFFIRLRERYIIRAYQEGKITKVKAREELTSRNMEGSDINTVIDIFSNEGKMESSANPPYV